MAAADEACIGCLVPASSGFESVGVEELAPYTGPRSGTGSVACMGGAGFAAASCTNELVNEPLLVPPPVAASAAAAAIGTARCLRSAASDASVMLLSSLGVEVDGPKVDSSGAEIEAPYGDDDDDDAPQDDCCCCC